MRRGRIFFYLAFILILGLVAVVVIWQRFRTSSVAGPTEAVPTPVVDVVNVIVVTQQVPRGARLDANVLGMVPIQRDLFIQGMFTDIMAVDGRLAKFDLDPGIPLTSSMLVDQAEQLSDTGSIAALSIPRGMVAVSIPISRLSSISYAPQPGDHVNVIGTLLLIDMDTEFQSILPNWNSGVVAPGTGEGELSGSVAQSQSSTLGSDLAQDQSQTGNTGQTGFKIIDSSAITAVSGAGGNLHGRAATDPVLGQTFFLIPSERQRPRMVSQNVLQDVVVLRVGNFPFGGQQTIQPEPDPSQPTEASPTPVPGEEQLATVAQPPDVITLIVTPQDAITLNYLIYSGAQLTLALRAAEDDTRVETEAVTLQFLLDQYNIPVPVKLPYGIEPRVDRLTPPILLNDLPSLEQ